MTQASDREDLGYRTDGFSPIQIEPEDDNVTEGVLESILNVVNGAGVRCGDMNAINLKHPKLSAEQQILAYQFALNELIIPIQDQIEDVLARAKVRYKK